LLGSLAPFAAILYRALTHRLGANPVATALNQLGLLALVFLIASLACTPLKTVLGSAWPIRIRKTLGLAAFFTALLHFTVYFVLDQELRIGRVVTDVVKRPFIAVGFIALVLLLPLALTSTKASLVRLGFARWKRIHRLAYVCGVLGVLHFYMRVKADVSEPLVWGSVLALLFAVRIMTALRKPQKGTGRVAA
jgi:sulfoxide reductase heme-binding subunit YedZ